MWVNPCFDRFLPLKSFIRSLYLSFSQSGSLKLPYFSSIMTAASMYASYFKSLCSCSILLCSSMLSTCILAAPLYFAPPKNCVINNKPLIHRGHKKIHRQIAQPKEKKKKNCCNSHWIMKVALYSHRRRPSPEPHKFSVFRLLHHPVYLIFLVDQKSMSTSSVHPLPNNHLISRKAKGYFGLQPSVSS